jgi:hypothetical protein
MEQEDPMLVAINPRVLLRDYGRLELPRSDNCLFAEIECKPMHPVLQPEPVIIRGYMVSVRSLSSFGGCSVRRFDIAKLSEISSMISDFPVRDAYTSRVSKWVNGGRTSFKLHAVALGSVKVHTASNSVTVNRMKSAANGRCVAS